MSKWLEGFATQCGHSVPLLEGWDLPKYCKDCKAENDKKWIEIRCATTDCGNTFKIRIEWNPVQYCKGCKDRYPNQNLTCSICSNLFVWSTGSQINARENHWNPPQKCPNCREFIKNNLSIKTNCKFCYNLIEWTSFHQLMEQHKGWQRSAVCKECKRDRTLLIQGALSDFTEKIYVKDEKPSGTISYIAVVYRSRDSTPIAHISIAKSIGEGRVAITKRLSDNSILKTTDRHTKTVIRFQEGILVTTCGDNRAEQETRIEKHILGEGSEIITRNKSSKTTSHREILNNNDYTKSEEKK